MSENFCVVCEGYWVAPQITADDVASAAAMGVTLIVNNRPDGEAPGQPSGAEIEAAAVAAGLAYAFIPVDRRGITPDHMAAFDRARHDAGDGVTLAYCRSGMRSILVHAYARACAGAPVEQIVAEAAASGYDIAGHGPALSTLVQSQKAH